MCAPQNVVLPPSIVLSVSIVPSRRMRGLLLLAALAHAWAAWSMLAATLDVAWAGLFAGSSGLAASLCALAAVQPLKTRRIDISKVGGLRLTVQQKLPDPGCAVRLLPGSLLWEQLLVLRLCRIDVRAAPLTVLVLPDSTGRQAFRALSVAMRSIAAQHVAKDEKIA